MNEFQRLAYALCVLGSLAFALPAHSATPFFDDFEDGDHAGWLVSTTGGSGSTGVASNNGSQMAYVQHTGSNWHSLSHDFAYMASQHLSFDMLARVNAAVLIGGTLHAGSGVDISFLDRFNQSLGKASLYNATNPAAYPNAIRIDGLQHHYDASLGDFASLAGLDPTDPIAKVSVAFYAWGESCCASNSSATVWFDNVAVVPEPQAYALMLAGLAGLGFAARRRNIG